MPSLIALTQIELPNHLGVDLSHCKDAAEAVGKRGPDEGILYSQDELFADEYFAGLASDVAATLESKTLLSLGGSGGGSRMGRTLARPCVLLKTLSCVHIAPQASSL